MRRYACISLNDTLGPITSLSLAKSSATALYMTSIFRTTLYIASASAIAQESIFTTSRSITARDMHRIIVPTVWRRRTTVMVCNSVSSASHRANQCEWLGFDLATTNNTQIRDSTVINQDDCVAVTSGNEILVSNMYCNGSHGLSIGSVGGKSNNNVTNITLYVILWPSTTPPRSQYALTLHRMF